MARVSGERSPQSRILVRFQLTTRQQFWQARGKRSPETTAVSSRQLHVGRYQPDCRQIRPGFDIGPIMQYFTLDRKPDALRAPLKLPEGYPRPRKSWGTTNLT